MKSGLVFLPSLSKKGIIAVKNPFIKSEDGNTGAEALKNYLRSKKHKRISLVDIIFLIC